MLQRLRSRLRGSWTIMIMAQAHQPVIRFKFPKILLYIGLLLIFTLSVSSAGIYLYSQSLAQKNSNLTNNLDQRSEELNSLKSEAAQVQATLEELETMEQKMRQITDFLKPEGSDRQLQSSSRGGIKVSAANRQLVKGQTVTYEALQEQLPSLMYRYEDTFYKFSELEKELRYIPTIWPTSATRVTSEFGKRDDPFSYTPATHTGFDIAGPWGSPIYAGAEGKVVLAGYDGGYGNSIVIRHSSKYSTRYGHMAKLNVSVGETVKKGQIIGQMGSTGRSTGVHLHYEVLKYGIPIDPYPYMTLNLNLGGQ